MTCQKKVKNTILHCGIISYGQLRTSAVVAHGKFFRGWQIVHSTPLWWATLHPSDRRWLPLPLLSSSASYLTACPSPALLLVITGGSFSCSPPQALQRLSPSSPSSSLLGQLEHFPFSANHKTGLRGESM